MPAKRKNPKKDETWLGSGHETGRLRLLFLIPLAFAIVLIMAVLVLALYWHEEENIHNGVLRIRASAHEFYEESIRYDASALQAIMTSLRSDQILQTALARKDRQQLYMRSATLFAELKRNFSITHLYFSDPARVNLLRVHSPLRHSDKIDRVTTLQAEKNGTTSFGVELGPLGTFTLRLVTPWFDEKNQRLLGYVELGIEIDRVLEKLRSFFGVDVYVFIHKEYLDQIKWEDGMRSLGRTPNWERFPTVVLGNQSQQNVPYILAKQVEAGNLTNTHSILKAVYGPSSYRIAFLPLTDAGGRIVAHMAILADVSRETNAAISTIYAGSLTAFVAGLGLFIFFFWQVGQIGRRIENDAKSLADMASHDGLTGLYNHRNFYKLLEEEISRARRYHHALSLIMIDIDHFKHVNDSHGHQAGDKVLVALAKLLSDEVRSMDRVCRYGGEEMAIILPETADAAELAERLRENVEKTGFEIARDKHISITISLGLASYPQQANNAKSLVSAADGALYAAKHGGRNRVVVAG